MAKGSCLCNALQFEIAGPIQAIGNCHCSMCRKTHGAPYSTYAQIERDHLKVLAGEANLNRFSSSDPVTRSFCATCGSNFSFEFEGVPQAIWIAVGLLEDDPSLRPQHHMFTGSKASWHDITDDLPQHETYPPLPGE